MESDGCAGHRCRSSTLKQWLLHTSSDKVCWSGGVDLPRLTSPLVLVLPHLEITIPFLCSLGLQTALFLVMLCDRRLTALAVRHSLAGGPFRAASGAGAGPKMLMTVRRSEVVKQLNAIGPSSRDSDRQPLAMTTSCWSQAKCTQVISFLPFIWRMRGSAVSDFAGAKASLVNTPSSCPAAPTRMRCCGDTIRSCAGRPRPNAPALICTGLASTSTASSGCSWMRIQRIGYKPWSTVWTRSPTRRSSIKTS